MMACVGMGGRVDVDSCLREDVNMSWAEIGRRIGRHPSTVYREVTRNGGRSWYRPGAAQDRADQLGKRPKQFKLVTDQALRARVTADLAAGYSPAAISHRLSTGGGATVAAETIYRAVYTGVLDVEARKCLHSLRPRRKPRLRSSWEKGHYLGEYTPISKRPATVNARVEAGHWEGDLIIGRYNQSGMVTLIERVTRLTHLIALPNGYGTKPVIEGLTAWLDGLPESMRRSLTWDQGGEMTRWKELLGHVDAVYFCDARSPWQRGSNEQNNRTLRYWARRTADLSVLDPTPILAIINTQPRRILGWATPLEIYHNHLTVH